MSFVVVAPEVLAAAASDLAGIGSTLAQANAAALAPTTAVLAAYVYSLDNKRLWSNLDCAPS
ncbi:PE domain-containing protein, partial [Mycobacterium tuberculosis]|nr:PE domain-containing protein [Mycobacterium tuberculosis]